MSTAGSPKKARFYTRIPKVFLCMGLLYGLVIVLIMTPFLQSHVLYAQHIHFISYTKFEHPEHYGLAPGKTTNLKLHSSDNTSIGAWFVFSDPFYRKLAYPPPPPQPDQIIKALDHAPTVLFLHGNTGTRAHPLRTVLYTTYTARLNANVLAIDYRGFGDSEGHPTVQGVSKDARAGWDYLIEHGARPEDVLIVGHSLGTAIAGLLAAELGKDGIQPRGLVLMSPFSSVRTLIDQYYLFGFLPLLKPLAMVPLAPRLITWSLVHRFDTLTLVPDIKCSVLIVHAENDWDIPYSHSQVLFDAFLETTLPHSPPLPKNPLLHADWQLYTGQPSLHAQKRDQLVSTTQVTGYGTLEQAKIQGRNVALLLTEAGGHGIGRVEGVHETIGRMFGFY